MSKQIKNMPASVHERLLNVAKQDRRSFNELLQYFAMDRFLYRWSKSQHAKRIVLKGALMLRVWEANEFRSTKDIDMLANYTSNNLDAMMQVVKDVTTVDVEPDGLNFQPATVTAERITEDADYEGVRIRFKGNLGNAVVNMQIDIGFGDIVYPGPIDKELPSMLEFPKAHLLCYSMESAIAEKFQAMVYLGDANSRMKDFFDIYTLSRQFDFDGITLAEAIQLTFRNRATEIPSEVDSFRREFITMKESQWKAFRAKLGHGEMPESFDAIIKQISEFLLPVCKTTSPNNLIPEIWNAPGPWR
jgi:hypothetical protein